MSVEKNVLKPIVFSIPTVASTNTNVDLGFSEELLCAWRLQGSGQRFISGGGWKYSGPSGLLWWLSCASQPLPLSLGRMFVLTLLCSP